MKKAQVIIGGGFGDEGKGLFTDYLSAQHTDKACVVRFNGGAQAGHTVQLVDGRRHVFSHFGSGSFAGLPTYLSSYFVCNPIIFLREYQELRRMECKAHVSADPACPVTTPFDMMINQIAEESRGKARHGSVGVGFGETLERHSHANYALSLCDLQDSCSLRRKLRLVQKEWVPARLKKLNVESIRAEWQTRLNDLAITERYIEDCGQFIQHITLQPLSALHDFPEIIFEGAQGLLLDQNYGWFPHVTRSNTGIKNVAEIAEKLGLAELDVYYLTRSYVTRHGAGPLPHALPEQPYSRIIDKTNQPNPYQGALRFARLDLDLFADTVRRDLSHKTTSFKINASLGMSCLDQIDSRAYYFSSGVLESGSPEALLDKAGKAIGANILLGSYGPTRQTISQRRRQQKFSSFLGSESVLQSFDTAKSYAFAVV